MTPEKYQRVKEIYQAAVEYDPQGRVAFLEEACANDELLRTEVDSLLSFLDRAESFIETPAFGVGARLLRDDVESLAGKRIGHYELISEIGHGGMGSVYLAARADDQFRKQVAVKILRRGVDSEDIRRRFRHERQILAGLEHPNIARLLDGGATDDGLPYLVMEYVEGLRVDEYSDANRLSTLERLKLFLTICSAVTYAHQKLIIHRDLKPANVLVTADGVPKLLDFGIAKLFGSDTDDGSDGHTVTQLGVMTPEYASPEQVRGEQVTTSTDVYSLGVLLYELLTGQRPYRITSRRPDDVAHVICEQEPSKPSTALRDRARESRGDGVADETSSQVSRSAPLPISPSHLRGDLDNIVLMALRKEPQRRYASVPQLADDIQRHLNGLPVAARTDTWGYRSSKFIRRHKAGVAASVIVLLALAIGLTVATWQARVAAQQRDRARAEAQKAEQLNSFLQQLLASADPSAKGRNVTVAQLLGAAAQRVETEFPGQPETAAALRSTIGMTYLALGLFDDAEPHLRSSLDSRRGLFGRNHPDVATSMNNLALLLAERGNIPEAEGLYREALDISRAARGPDHLATATIMHDFGALLQLKGAFEEAERMHRESLVIRRRGLGNNHKDVAQSLNDLAVVLGTKGDLQGAEQLHREALAMMRRLYAAEHPDVAATLGTLAAIIEERGDYKEAEALYLEALAMRRKLLGPEHPTVAWTTYNYAYMLWRKGDYESSVRLAREVLGLRGKTLNDEHPMVHSSLQVLGRSLMGHGKAKAAEPALKESLELRRKAMPAGHWLIAASESVLGECLTAQRRYAEAEPLLQSGYNGLKSALGEQHSRTLEAHERLLKLYKARPRRE